jgi:hypothetical protein
VPPHGLLAGRARGVRLLRFLCGVCQYEDSADARGALQRGRHSADTPAGAAGAVPAPPAPAAGPTRRAGGSTGGMPQPCFAQCSLLPANRGKRCRRGPSTLQAAGPCVWHHQDAWVEGPARAAAFDACRGAGGAAGEDGARLVRVQMPSGCVVRRDDWHEHCHFD